MYYDHHSQTFGRLYSLAAFTVVKPVISLGYHGWWPTEPNGWMSVGDWGFTLQRLDPDPKTEPEMSLILAVWTESERIWTDLQELTPLNQHRIEFVELKLRMADHTCNNECTHELTMHFTALSSSSDVRFVVAVPHTTVVLSAVFLCWWGLAGNERSAGDKNYELRQEVCSSMPHVGWDIHHRRLSWQGNIITRNRNIRHTQWRVELLTQSSLPSSNNDCSKISKWTSLQLRNTNPSMTRRIKEILRVCLYGQGATAGAYK